MGRTDAIRPESTRTRTGTYRVHGRRFEGRLCAPIRNDTETQEYDDRATALYYGHALAVLGYRVWVYERGECSPMDQPRWTAVAEWASGGARID